MRQRQLDTLAQRQAAMRAKYRPEKPYYFKYWMRRVHAHFLRGAQYQIAGTPLVERPGMRRRVAREAVVVALKGEAAVKEALTNRFRLDIDGDELVRASYAARAVAVPARSLRRKLASLKENGRFWLSDAQGLAVRRRRKTKVQRALVWGLAYPRRYDSSYVRPKKKRNSMGPRELKSAEHCLAAAPPEPVQIPCASHT
jgi:hypothetical protein